MAIIPESLESAEIETSDGVRVPEPTKTYELLNGRIGGYVDGEDAIKQYVAKAIRTARNRFLIYDEDYGSELEELIGESVTRELLEEEIPRVIKEAIIYDDRISSVGKFGISNTGDKVYVKFTVTLATGQTLESEVSVW